MEKSYYDAHTQKKTKSNITAYMSTFKCLIIDFTCSNKNALLNKDKVLKYIYANSFIFFKYLGNEKVLEYIILLLQSA